MWMNLTEAEDTGMSLRPRHQLVFTRRPETYKELGLGGALQCRSNGFLTQRQIPNLEEKGFQKGLKYFLKCLIFPLSILFNNKRKHE